MEKTEFSSLIDIFKNNETDINVKLLRFLNESNFTSKSNAPIKTDYEIVTSPCKISDLLNEGEYIRTSANEVPQENGGWTYNGGCIYNLYYILLENDNLLVIEQKESINLFPGDPIYIRFSLYPNAHQFIIKTQNGHRPDKPYVNIVNCNGELISEFYFELPYDKSAVLNGVSLQNAITPVSVMHLISRYQEKLQNKQHILSKKG